VLPTVLGGGPAKKSDAPEPTPPVPGRTAVLHGGIVTLPDGSEVDLGVDNADVTELAVLTDGRVVLAMQKPYVVRVYEPGSARHTDYPVQANAITTSSRDDAVAWVAEDFAVRVLASGVAEPTELAGIPMAGEAVGSIDAVLDAEHLLVGDYNTTTGEVTPAGYREIQTDQDLRVTDASPDGSLWAVNFDGPNQQYGCSGLYDPDTRQLIGEDCTTPSLTFSPDGKHLVGAYGDNNMYGNVEIFDLDGVRVGTYRPDPQVVSRFAWADSEHLLVTVANWHDNQWSLVRVGLDGTDPQVLEGPEDGRNPETVVELLLSE
jgi:hypothetical protein